MVIVMLLSPQVFMFMRVWIIAWLIAVCSACPETVNIKNEYDLARSMDYGCIKNNTDNLTLILMNDIEITQTMFINYSRPNISVERVMLGEGHHVIWLSGKWDLVISLSLIKIVPDSSLDLQYSEIHDGVVSSFHFFFRNMTFIESGFMNNGSVISIVQDIPYRAKTIPFDELYISYQNGSYGRPTFFSTSYAAILFGSCIFEGFRGRAELLSISFFQADPHKGSLTFNQCIFRNVSAPLVIETGLIKVSTRQSLGHRYAHSAREFSSVPYSEVLFFKTRFENVVTKDLNNTESERKHWHTSSIVYFRGWTNLVLKNSTFSRCKGLLVWGVHQQMNFYDCDFLDNINGRGDLAEYWLIEMRMPEVRSNAQTLMSLNDYDPFMWELEQYIPHRPIQSKIIFLRCHFIGGGGKIYSSTGIYYSHFKNYQQAEWLVYPDSRLEIVWQNCVFKDFGPFFKLSFGTWVLGYWDYATLRVTIQECSFSLKGNNSINGVNNNALTRPYEVGNRSPRGWGSNIDAFISWNNSFVESQLGLYVALAAKFFWESPYQIKLSCTTMCKPGTYMPISQSGQILDCPPGDCNPNTCPTTNLENFNQIKEGHVPTCVPCEQGFYSTATAVHFGRDACQPCEGLATTAGVGASSPDDCVCIRGFQNVSVKNDWLCAACPEGTFRGDLSTSVCLPCNPGTYSDRMQQSVCRECDKGEYQPDIGNTIGCLRCSTGTYTDTKGASKCSSCPTSRSTTPGSLADSISSCICLQGTYPRGEMCLPCLEGMICNGTFGFSIQKGYYSPPNDNASIYICNYITECPGGPPGTCAAHRIGISCTQCEAGYQPSWSGDCKLCTLGIWGVLIVFIIFVCTMIGALLVNYFFPRMVMSKYVRSFMNILSIFTFCILVISYAPVSLFEVGSVIETLHGIIQSVIDAMKFASLRCAFYVSVRDDFLIHLSSPGCVLTLSLLLLLPGIHFGYFSIYHIYNLVGALWSTFFVFIVALSFRGFQCVLQPNGFLTWHYDHSIHCYKGDHIIILGVSVAAVLVYVIPFVTFLTWVTLNYHYLFSNHYQFIRASIFFLSKFRPSCYGFALIILYRSLFVGLVPIFLIDYPILVVLCEQFLIFCWFVLQGIWRPWRVQYVNYFDSFSSLNLVYFFSMVMSLRHVLDIVVSDILITVVWSLFWMVFVVMVAFLIVRRFFLQKSMFMYFLSHHKAEAQTICRVLKFMLQDFTKRQVFLDVDDQSTLETLFDAVQDCETLVIIGTRGVLSRFWCALEIVAAVRRKKDIIFLQTPDVPCIDANIDQSLEILIQDHEIELVEYGVSIDMLIYAYQSLKDSQSFPFCQDKSISDIENTVREIAKSSLQKGPTTFLASWVEPKSSRDNRKKAIQNSQSNATVLFS